MQPSDVAFDATSSGGSVIILDLFAIYRLFPNGTLSPISTAPRNCNGVFDGFLTDGSATFCSLGGIVFASKSAFIVGDTYDVECEDCENSLVPFGVLREIDTVNGTVRRIAGALPGIASAAGGNDLNGLSALDTPLSSPTGLSLSVHGNIVIADEGSGLLRIIVSPNTSSVFCPAGYTCPCGTPLACTDPSTFCPSNTLTPIHVTNGFYSVSATVGSIGYVSQAACPPGYFCSGGVLQSCPAGSFGVAGSQSAATGCVACPLGTYSTSFASQNSSTCLACPPGSYAQGQGSRACAFCPVGTAAAEASSSGIPRLACAPCSGGTTALPGSRSCVSLSPSQMLSSASTTGVVQLIAPPVYSSTTDEGLAAVYWIQVKTISPIVFVAAIPALFLAISCCTRSWLKCSETRVAACCRYCPACFRCCIRYVDLFSLGNYIETGESPVKRRTALGGGMSVLACGVICGIAASLFEQYLLSNVLVNESLLSVTIPGISKYAAFLPFTLAGALPPYASATAPPQGFEIRITTMGSPCSEFTFINVTGLLAGNITTSIDFTVSDPPTGLFVHAITCGSCALGPLSLLSVGLPTECQALLLSATTVGATGDVYMLAIDAQQPSGIIGALYVTLQLQLEVVDDEVSDVHTRGYVIAAADVVPSFILSPSSNSLAINFDLRIAHTFAYTQILKKTTLVQFVSSISGLIGILNFFGVVFVCMDWLFPSAYDDSRKKAELCGFIAGRARRRQLRRCPEFCSHFESVSFQIPRLSCFQGRCCKCENVAVNICTCKWLSSLTPGSCCSCQRRYRENSAYFPRCWCACTTRPTASATANIATSSYVGPSLAPAPPNLSQTPVDSDRVMGGVDTFPARASQPFGPLFLLSLPSDRKERFMPRVVAGPE